MQPTDVSLRQEVDALADAAYREFGHVDVLVNNAGVTLRPFRASWDTSLEDLTWVFAVNFWGVVHGHQVFVPRMRDTPSRKHIVNTSSMSYLIGSPGHSAYAASKAAVDAFSIAAAVELATQNIGLTILYPGHVTTRIHTSERLRPQTERYASRDVKPWSSYVAAEEADDDPRFGGRAAGARSEPFLEPLDPDAVGPMVLEAIMSNSPFCLTHPAPEAAMQRRHAQIVNGCPRQA
jgi:NAD(P)-dependent dehydrogenase (short-subunit alcohol dehydrogenase family)